jgi:murein DD-endopeptidase MepM/ murein hydrolase activator NlpD
MGNFGRRKTYYKYNPNTLTYERVYPSAKERFLVVLRHLSLGILIGTGAFFAFIHFFASPMEALLRKENMLLKTQYEVLSLRLNDALEVLDDIQERDDNLYRAIFQVKTIPEYVRKPGIGGSNRYDYLMNLSNADLVVETTKKIDMMKRQLYVQSNSLDELMALGKNMEERIRCVPAIMPLSNKDLKRTASGFGMRIDPFYGTLRFHTGMDFTAETGTEIYATGDGTVIFSDRKQGYGNCIMIDHGFGFKTLYGHNNKNLVRVGQKVVRGEVIGHVGNTGKSKGPHLHYEVMVNDKHDNPAKYYFMDLTPEEYDQMIQIAENRGQVMD